MDPWFKTEEDLEKPPTIGSYQISEGSYMSVEITSIDIFAFYAFSIFFPHNWTVILKTIFT